MSFWYRVGQGGGDATVVERWDGRAVQFLGTHTYGAAGILGVPLRALGYLFLVICVRVL